MPINKVILSGFLSQEPELKNVGQDKKVCNFSVGTTEVFKSGKKSTEYHRCVALGFNAEVASVIPKGAHIDVSGKLKTRSWEGKNGEKRYATEVLVSEVSSDHFEVATQEHEDGSVTIPMGDSMSVGPGPLASAVEQGFDEDDIPI